MDDQQKPAPALSRHDSTPVQFGKYFFRPGLRIALDRFHAQFRMLRRLVGWIDAGDVAHRVGTGLDVPWARARCRPRPACRPTPRWFPSARPDRAIHEIATI